MNFYTFSAVLTFAVLTCASASRAGSTITYYGPTGGPVPGWDTGTDNIAWTAVASLNDTDDGGTKLDFVGDSNDNGFFLASDEDHLFFRMRVNIGSAPINTFSDAHLILIDVLDWNYPVGGETGKPDFSFAWDSKSNDPDAHGLEMQIPDSLGLNWDDIKMDDIDGANGSKGPEDINTTGEGYLRTIDGNGTANFGDTTFIDYAIQKAYLERADTTGHLLDAQGNLLPLRIQLGSIANATDHNAISNDVAGGFAPTDSVVSSWSDIVVVQIAAVPEPSILSYVVIIAIVLILTRSRKSLPAPHGT